MIGSRISARTPWEKNINSSQYNLGEQTEKLPTCWNFFNFFVDFIKSLIVYQRIWYAFFGALTSQAAWRTCYVGYEKINGILEWVNKWSKGSHHNKLQLYVHFQ